MLRLILKSFLGIVIIFFLTQFILVDSLPDNHVDESLIKNGGFEDGLSGWKPLWVREPGKGKVDIDNYIYHNGQSSARIEYTGMQDWSFEPAVKIPVTTGGIFELESWIKISGNGEATLCVVTYDSSGATINRTYAAQIAEKLPDWQKVSFRFIIPQDVAMIKPRWIGKGPATTWIDDFFIRKVMIQKAANLPPALTVDNSIIAVTLNTKTATFSVIDKRIAKVWQQQNFTNDLIVENAGVSGGKMTVALYSVSLNSNFTVSLELEKAGSEFTIIISGAGPMVKMLQFPCPFTTDAGTSLIVPLNEGIAYPVDDAAIHPLSLMVYSGQGLSMSFSGVTDGNISQMAIIETPDDASIRIERNSGKLAIAPVWEPQKGQFGYSRRIRYIFQDHGGFVAMCKRYRAYARKSGLLKTLAEKRRENPNVDMLVGAADVWCWEKDALSLIREMQSAGFKKILWSASDTQKDLKSINDLGILTSRYDCYQDIMNPANFQFLNGVNPCWITPAWPDDIIIDANGQWVRGWQVKGNNGQKYPCGVLCDSMALKYAKSRIPADLMTRPYRCRFIDTATASSWRECYCPDHPLNRTQSREWRMKLLEYGSRDLGLVIGSETGHDAAVPYLHYFEGMMSLFIYRVKSTGIRTIINEVPEQISKFQLGQRYRIPLWELVYHDCVVSFWFWDDYSNKIPAVWDKRDLFNILYGTPPMFMFDQDFWRKNRARFIQSYQNISPIVLKNGYAEMTDFRFLDPAHDVQQAIWANGSKVTVNFGPNAYHGPDGTEIQPMGYLFTY